MNLRQAMPAGRFTPQQALAIVPGICDALQAALAQGVWHREVDHRADIYSLGVVIYEMLTGELPLGRFPSPSQRAAVDSGCSCLAS